MTRSFVVAVLVFALSLFAAAASAAQPGMRCVQSQLTALGFDPGSVDGFYGGKTRSAADAYNEWISLKDGDLVLPPLTKTNGMMWCEQIASAVPEMAKFNIPDQDYVLLVQFRGEVPASFAVRIGTERANTPDCAGQPCLITPMKRVTLNRDPSGVSTISVTLTERATRACVQMTSGAVTIEKSELFLNSGGKKSSRKGGDLEANGMSACSDSGSDAKKANTWMLTLG